MNGVRHDCRDLLRRTYLELLIALVGVPLLRCSQRERFQMRIETLVNSVISILKSIFVLIGTNATSCKGLKYLTCARRL
jgi:hypothetical protein